MRRAPGGRPGGESRAAVVLDPVVRRLVTAAAAPPSLDDLGPDTARQALREAQVDRFEDFDVDAVYRVASVGPSGLLGFWTVRPAGATGPLPTLLYVHGGRWTLGDAQTHARLISEVVRGAQVCAVVPEYSRTPEVRYPVALEECYELLTWAVSRADELGLDGRRVAVAGDCAGATLAAAVTMLAKSRGGPRLSAQLLYYPLTDSRCDSPSQRQFATGYLLTRRALRTYWARYVTDPALHDEPTASPLRARTEDLVGLPPALIVTAEADVARDEGEQYARNLCEAGVEASAVRFLGTVHDFVALHALDDSAPTRAALLTGYAFLSARLH
ncbi:alpha/beta hydrolase [Streptomyces broussonetiae]|uniref:Alpha/beta hydrolase fold domain-containing protein n=1 Tax=Streptomyces broussonetiae TaxID=2686304 RepID=A0A6I6MV22_9ACTN|nr:alpha/beta hydrolase [Streptomyces broussonetiae]QHA03272.1 alpha/beta hydrolase fold domain-containing protein [Streptomyces broussonetiae]